MLHLDKRPLPYSTKSTALFEKISGMRFPVFLDSCSDLREENGKDFISAEPEKVFIADNNRYQILDGSGKILEEGRKPLEKILLFEKETNLKIFGYFGYHCTNENFKLEKTISENEELPDICLGFYRWYIEIDHLNKETSLAYIKGSKGILEIEQLLAILSEENRREEKEKHVLTESAKSNFSRSTYRIAFDRIKEYILEGDCYQVNLAQRFSQRFQGNAWQHYLTLRKKSPAPFCAFFSTNKGQILSFSPESFLKIDSEGKIISQPIKGTRKRFDDESLDRQSRESLQKSQKDKAENLMIVDLIRNDLSKNALANSVKVERLFDIQSFSNVHHMVSTVTAEKPEQTSPLKVMLDCFPGGSITGAPKKRAMEIINELEPNNRQVYCGAIGYLSPDKELEFNIAIRTIVIKDDFLFCWGGGGLVADSEFEAEYQESINKISNLISID